MAVYPGVYRAKAIKLTGTVLSAYIPQVFGDVQVTIENYVGSAPSTSEMGWVSFQGGNAEFPVWHGAGQGNGGGGGGTVTDTLWVGPEPPFDPSIEMWYDTNDTTSFASAADVWNTAWGVVASAVTPPNVMLTTAYVSAAAVTTTLLVDRRYALFYSVRAMDASVVGIPVLTNLFKDGVEVTIADKYTYAAPPSGYNGSGAQRWLLTGDGVSHTFSIRAKVASGTGQIHSQPEGGASGLTIEDIGPVTRQPSTFTPPVTDWSVFDSRYAPGPWRGLPMSSPWTSTNPYGFATPQYRLVGDIVYMRGTTQNPSAPGTTNSNIGILPVGYRPPVPLIFVGWMSWNGAAGRDAVRINIDSIGQIALQGTFSQPSNATAGTINNVDHLSLDGICFSVTP